MTLAVTPMQSGGLFRRAVRIVTSGPAVAYQFGGRFPVTGSYSDDATVLFPTSALGTFHVVAGVPSHTTGPDKAAWLAIAAPAGPTQVTVAPSVPLEQGIGLPIEPGKPQTVTLGAHDVLNLRSTGPGDDLTGTLVESTAPVAVFTGNEIALPPGVDGCCMDHLEHQLPPTAAWGTVHVAGRSQPRWQEPEHWRVVAAHWDTVVSFQPLVAPETTLQPGDHVDISTGADFVVTASRPVLLAQILASCGELPDLSSWSQPCVTADDCSPGHDCVLESSSAPQVGCLALGDPSLILVPPAEQHLPTYAFVVPAGYARGYVTITSVGLPSLAIDGVPLPPQLFEAIAGTPAYVVRRPIEAGFHRVASDGPIAVTVYGWSEYVSYGYAAGWGLATP